jgi:hypothetical protein
MVRQDIVGRTPLGVARLPLVRYLPPNNVHRTSIAMCASFSSVTSSTMKTPAETCSAARGKSSRVTAVIEAAERAGMHAGRRATTRSAPKVGMIK